MERFKRLLYALLFPHAAVPLLLVPFSAAALVYVFVSQKNDSALAIICYVLSFYTLTVCTLRAPALLHFLRRAREHHPFLHRLTTDARFRLKLVLHGSLAINTAYALFQLGMGFYYRSRWFYALAVYYVLLTVMRYFLLRDLKSLDAGADLEGELRRYRFCGVALAAMTPALIVIVAFILWQNRGFSYHSITTIAMAAYTFGAFTVATVNIIKYRKHHSPLLSAAKAVSMTTASVSMLSLETAMLSAFGEESDALFRTLITGLSGLAVCLFVLGMAIFMILRAGQELKKLQQGAQDGISS